MSVTRSLLAPVKRRHTASGDLQRKNRSTTVGGFTGVDVQNRFMYYEQMSLMSPHIFVPLHKTALSICKSFRFEGDDAMVKDFDAWAKRINLGSKIRTMVRLTCRNGTFVARWKNEEGFTDPKRMDFEPLIMSKLTIIPKGYNPDDPGALEKNNMILTPEIDKFWINEGASDTELIKKYDPKDVVYIALYPFDYIQKDIKDRDTYGLFGISLLESISDLFDKYMDVIEGFVNWVKKYGNGRYHINYVVLEDMIKEGNITEAIEVLELLKTEHQTLMANDDIVSAGCEIKTLDTGGGSLSITDFKASLENDIEIGLMQMPLTMGKGEGSTYASGYISESDRLLTLEGIQQEFVSQINEQIVKTRYMKMREESEEADENWQDKIQLVMDEISEPSLALADIVQAVVNDMITIDEGREFIDLKPATGEISNGLNPTKIQAEQAKAQLELQAKSQQDNMDMQQQNAKIQQQAIKQQGRQPVPGKSNTQVSVEKSQKTKEKQARTSR